MTSTDIILFFANKINLPKWLLRFIEFLGVPQNYYVLLIRREHIRYLRFLNINRIKYNILPKSSWKSIHKGVFILKGDWDINDKLVLPINEYTSVQKRTVNQLFVEGKGIEETEQFQYMIKYMDAPELPLSGYRYKLEKMRSVENITEDLRNIVRTYYSIKNNGYRLQSELGGNKNDEIKVNINRNGEFILGSGGNHRYEIAKMLNVKVVPVVIQHVHYLWALQCMNIYNDTMLNSLNKWLNDIDLRDEYYKGINDNKK